MWAKCKTQTEPRTLETGNKGQSSEKLNNQSEIRK